jgi:hypothetical protein
MSGEEEIISEIVKANAEALYSDAAKPAIRVIGKSLAQCASLFATPIGRMASIFEKIFIATLINLKEKTMRILLLQIREF